MKQTYFKFVLALFAAVFVSACSNDGGDGKDDKGEKQNGVAPASGALVQLACGSENDIAMLTQLRQQCYQYILARQPAILNELQGQNPFLIETWEKLDLNEISFAPQMLSCRNSFSRTCELK